MQISRLPLLAFILLEATLPKSTVIIKSPTMGDVIACNLVGDAVPYPA